MMDLLHYEGGLDGKGFRQQAVYTSSFRTNFTLALHLQLLEVVVVRREKLLGRS